MGSWGLLLIDMNMGRGYQPEDGGKNNDTQTTRPARTRLLQKVAHQIKPGDLGRSRAIVRQRGSLTLTVSESGLRSLWTLAALRLWCALAGPIAKTTWVVGVDGGDGLQLKPVPWHLDLAGRGKSPSSRDELPS
ncbi:uncharacterized protein PG998_008227 [Apiospora kogelbergensis]|uniref:Uncharacterized protein n=1 Tax=Apiospora kogelbergensis TaxID=1337665 RepID=A0AAW0QF93_9PEZI